MKKLQSTKGVFIAAAAALTLALSATGATSAAENKAAKGPGLCTAHVNALKMGYLNYRTSSGTLLPTVMWCPESTCPAKC
jgi:hypothetical protein